MANDGLAILSCRWGLGEGYDPADFKPIPIPKHLLDRMEKCDSDGDDSRQSSPLPPSGRGAALGSCSNARQPGGYTAHLGPTSLSIQQQVDRTGMFDDATRPDYSQFLLPSEDDSSSCCSSSRAASSSAAPTAASNWPLVRDTAPRSHTANWHRLLDDDIKVEAVENPLMSAVDSSRDTAKLPMFRRAAPVKPPAAESLSDFPPLGATSAPPARPTGVPSDPSVTRPDAADSASAAVYGGQLGEADGRVLVLGSAGSSWTDALEFAGQFGPLADVGHDTDTSDGVIGWIRFHKTEHADWLMEIIQDSPCDVDGIGFRRVV